MGWWAMLLLWPVPVYFLPLLIREVNEPDAAAAGDAAPGFSLLESALHTANSNEVMGPGGAAGAGGLGRPSLPGLLDDGVSATLLLLLLAGHAVVLTLSESLFAHKVTKTPLVRGMDAPEGPGLEDEV
ncbi:hypothetical protein COO60DRAFT_1458844 [Scenedesmus sp. NREL 46B-D3]|nr:hypothetical protein COO60DRAFT_1458844 [Scenedesmus sp. NREL 46B-D3]